MVYGIVAAPQCYVLYHLPSFYILRYRSYTTE